MNAGPRPREQRLAVYLSSERIGLLEDRTLGFVSFRFDDAVVARYADARPSILSVGLPVVEGWQDPLRATPFFAGLLPEGDVRTRLADELRLGVTDTFGFLLALGRECAGALVIVPEDDVPPGDGEVRWLTEDELADLLNRLGDAPLGVSVEDDAIRLSLAGAQDKLPVVIDNDGSIGLPLYGHPSTHILKPPSRRVTREGHLAFPDLVANEAFCLRLAGELGLPTAQSSVLWVAAEPVLCVERYDRVRTNGTVQRIHQEDVCQALGVEPANKYESGGGPGLTDVGELLRDVSALPVVDLSNLYRLVLVNALIGNADAHAKNISLLHAMDAIRLAPAYDLVSTAAYLHTDRMGMRLGGAERLRDVDGTALVDAGHACGVPERTAVRTRRELAVAVPGALERAQAAAVDEGWAANVLEGIQERVTEFAQFLTP